MQYYCPQNLIITIDKRRLKIQGWAWWLMPVIPALWEAKTDRSSEVRSSKPTWTT